MWVGEAGMKLTHLLTFAFLVTQGIGCLLEERDALLALKAAFTNPGEPTLLSWSDRSYNCCHWERVGCDKSTLRVDRLDFHRLFIGRASGWSLNSSLFLPFQELKTLDLNENELADINGTLRLKSLRKLNLGRNELKQVPSLRYLPSLRDLDLSNGFINVLTNLKGSRLETLNLENCLLLDGAMMPIMSIMSLKSLSVALNKLTSRNFLAGLCELRSLEELNLAQNKFDGEIPECFLNMTSIRALDLGSNRFTGTIPPSLFHNLESLEYINLSENSFQGELSLSFLANNSRLEEFGLVGNRQPLKIETERRTTGSPPFQLKVFHLSGCMLNEESGGVIPSFLVHLHDLRSVRLDGNGMKGDFPIWLLENNTNLESLDISGNHVSGSLDLPVSLNMTNMIIFSASDNFIDGSLPSNIGSVFSNLKTFHMAGNKLVGNIPSSFGDMKNLLVIDLSDNELSGEFPESSVGGAVWMLKLSNNNLRGELLPRTKNSTDLEYLYLDGNQFEGDISPGLLNYPLLLFLDASNNFLSGTIPDWMGDLDLTHLFMSNNSLHGPLPPSFCKLQYLCYLELSHNSFGPEIQLCANMTRIQYLRLQNIGLAGPLPEFLPQFSSLMTLDLADNALSGEIPAWIGTFKSMTFLLLKGNRLEGSIPRQLCGLNEISLMDLSNNDLSGVIPSCLPDLSGAIPALLPLQGSTYFFPYVSEGYPRNYSIGLSLFDSNDYSFSSHQVEVRFVSKNRLEPYTGNVLGFMSGIDLSCNKLTGTIPPELGRLSEARALNLSHNQLTGPIPETFAGLTSVESLDLSYNRLDGPIPPQLLGLYQLSAFCVAHNNLSGRIPEAKNQFATFGVTSYEGNPFLCGQPLPTCNWREQASEQAQGSRFFEDWFVWSFAGSFTIAFLGMVAFLSIDSYYRDVIFGKVYQHVPPLRKLVQ